MSFRDALLLFIIEEKNKKIKWKLRIGLIEKLLLVMIKKEKMKYSIALDIDSS